jgi:arginine N-succinyltransferase
LAFKVRRREHYSIDLQAGQVQVTLQLVRDTSAPTEVGGLVLSTAWRGSKHRLGSLLSLSRFSLIAHRPDRFNRRMIGEIMGDLTADGRTMLWDHLGRRFINLSYEEADRFSRSSREFITSLFPEGEIYVSLLPAEARRLIGRVSPEALPAMHMLERLGFKHCDEVDPFDGGPYLEADRDDIAMLRTASSCTLQGESSGEGEEMLVANSSDGVFRVVRCAVQVDGNGVRIPADAIEALEVGVGSTLGLTIAAIPASA